MTPSSYIQRDNMHTHESVSPTTEINYAFFTNERGSSTGGYLVSNESTRNVNLYSPDQKLPDGTAKDGYDTPHNVLTNIQSCYRELGATEHTHQFFMTSNYGKDGATIIVCNNREDVMRLKHVSETSSHTLVLDAEISTALSDANIFPVKADALIFKGIPEGDIAVLGASGDAHPIMMFDEVNNIASMVQDVPF